MYTKGQRVAIINRTMSGKFMFEGWATVVLDENYPDEQYRVRFEADGEEAERFIDQWAQDDPEAYVRKMNDRLNDHSVMRA